MSTGSVFFFCFFFGSYSQGRRGRREYVLPKERKSGMCYFSLILMFSANTRQLLGVKEMVFLQNLSVSWLVENILGVSVTVFCSCYST